jgi:chromosome segregation ATPase
MTDRPRAAVSPWLVTLIAALIGLLLLSNVLLWRIVDQTSGDDNATGAPVAATHADTKATAKPAAAKQPLLPQPTQGGSSNRATAAEVDRLSAQIAQQFATLRASLDRLPAQVKGGESVSAATAPITQGLGQLNARAASLDGVGEVRGILDRIKTRIASVAQSSSALQSDSATKLQRSNDGINESNSRLGDMSTKLSTSNEGIAGMSEKLSTSNAGIDATNRGLQDMSAKLGTSNDRIAKTNESLQALGATMTQVSQYMASMNSSLGGLHTDMQLLTEKMDGLLAVACSVPLGALPAPCR